MSNAYDYFCVASEGYKDFFIKNGVNPEKIVVTGIPNFDDCQSYKNNNFPHKNFVLVATSDARETYKIENRKKFIIGALKIAGNKQIIFKLHPNENFERAINEIKKYAPKALIYTTGNVHEMIANCDILITKYSSCVYTGIALNKTVFSDFDINELKKLAPLQNGGTSALNIANICKQLINKQKKNRKEMIDIYNQNISNKYKFEAFKINN
jgi:CDP-glycerol glycerophosphotransferase (TagB/SpsB family)